MTEVDVQLFSNLWDRLVRGEFAPQRLVPLLRHDGGLDIENISEEDILQLIKGGFTGDWHEPAFSFSELLAYYGAGVGTNMTKEQVVAWVVGALVLADAMDHDATDLELQFGIFLDGFLVAVRYLNCDESLHILRRFLCRGPTGPHNGGDPAKATGEILRGVEIMKQQGLDDPDLWDLLEKVEAILRKLGIPPPAR